jgi:3-oxoacyl-[acyl-carrier-protein] synthase II
VERIVVTGVGAITPIGNDAATFWSNLRAGVSGVGRITAFEVADDLPVKIAAEVKNFDPKDHIDFKAARRMDRFSQFAVAAAGEALRDACFTVTPENSTRVGVIMNTGGGGIPAIVNEVLTHDRRGPGRVSPFFIPMFAPNMAACQISLSYDIRGPVMASVAACAAGAQAFVDGLHLLRRGEADVLITGGTESGLDPVAIAAFANMQALSRRNGDPERASRPFDKDRDGFVFAEGCGALVLETESHARQRGARILCELIGGAMTADAFHITAPEPEGVGATAAMRFAMERAGITPADIDAIYAHATSTPLGDIAETKSIKQALGKRAYEIAISAPKSMVGHLVGASGAVNGVAAVLSLRDQVMAPTINLVTPDPECVLDYVPNVERPMELNTILTNAFGFGGQNVVTIFRRYE